MYINYRTTKNTIRTSKISVSKTLDGTGRLCPQLIVDADKVIHAIEIGGIIEIISTDLATKSCVPDWCDYTGHILLESKFNKSSYKFHYLVQRVKKTI